MSVHILRATTRRSARSAQPAANHRSRARTDLSRSGRSGERKRGPRRPSSNHVRDNCAISPIAAAIPRYTPQRHPDATNEARAQRTKLDPFVFAAPRLAIARANRAAKTDPIQPGTVNQGYWWPESPRINQVEANVATTA